MVHPPFTSEVFNYSVAMPNADESFQVTLDLPPHIRATVILHTGGEAGPRRARALSLAQSDESQEVYSGVPIDLNVSSTFGEATRYTISTHNTLTGETLNYNFQLVAARVVNYASRPRSTVCSLFGNAQLLVDGAAPSVAPGIAGEFELWSTVKTAVRACVADGVVTSVRVFDAEFPGALQVDADGTGGLSVTLPDGGALAPNDDTTVVWPGTHALWTLDSSYDASSELPRMLIVEDAYEGHVVIVNHDGRLTTRLALPLGVEDAGMCSGLAAAWEPAASPSAGGWCPPGADGDADRAVTPAVAARDVCGSNSAEAADLACTQERARGWSSLVDSLDAWADSCRYEICAGGSAAGAAAAYFEHLSADVATEAPPPPPSPPSPPSPPPPPRAASSGTR